MQIDYPPQPATLPSAHAADDVTSNGIYKIDDFLNTHKADHNAQIQAREAAQARKGALPPSGKNKTNENLAPLTLVAVGARSSKHTILLHEKYQALGIPQPLFTYEGQSDSGWTVQVSFPGLDIEELQGLSMEGVFNSKQEAKEALSKRALEMLEELEKEGRVSKAEKDKKQKNVSEQMSQQEKKEKEPGPNYVGQLLEFQRSTSSPQPTYTDYRAGNRFACLVTIDGHTDPFGTLESLHSSKKDARQAAARCAVEYFKAQGVWPEDSTTVGGIKKKKAQPTFPDIISHSPSGPDARKESITSSSPGNMSYAQQVAHLAVTLCLGSPEWRYTAHPADKDFLSVSCFFQNGGPHQGPIGEVRNIFGKKKAKEECARLTLEYLREVRDTRMSRGMKILEGISGSEEVVSVAAGRAVEGEKEAALARRQFVREMNGESEDEAEAEFEDAVEDLMA